VESASLLGITMEVVLDTVRFASAWALQALQRLLELGFKAGLGDQSGYQCERGGHQTSCLCAR
jgi:hypothetical protein